MVNGVFPSKLINRKEMLLTCAYASFSTVREKNTLELEGPSQQNHNQTACLHCKGTGAAECTVMRVACVKRTRIHSTHKQTPKHENSPHDNVQIAVRNDAQPTLLALDAKYCIVISKVRHPRCRNTNQRLRPRPRWTSCTF